MSRNVQEASEACVSACVSVWWLARLNGPQCRWCVEPAARTAGDRLLVFAVDPQEEAERKEQHLAVIADHLGFSWTGTPRPHCPPLRRFLRVFIPVSFFFFFFRVGTAAGLQREEDQPDQERKPQLASRPEPRPFKTLGGDGRSARHRLAATHAQGHTG